MKKNKWSLAYFPTDTLFIGFGTKDKRYKMLIRAGALLKIKEIKNEK